jgi:hypothetical protein
MVDMRRQMDRAREIVSDGRFPEAVLAVATSDDDWGEATADARRFLARRGIELPEGLTVRTIPWPGAGRPTPDWDPFVVQLTMCRTVWVRDPETHMLRREQICRGFEIVPNPLPGGPIGGGGASPSA